MANTRGHKGRKGHFLYGRRKADPAARGPCGKWTYPSASKAADAMKNLENSGHCKHGKGVMGVYYCEKCGGHHVGRDSRNTP